MKRFVVLLCALVVWTSSGMVWANSAPVVSNVAVSQRTDGSKKVDIRYDLSDADGDRCTISVQVSDDNGVTWTVPAVSFSGAIGPNISPGTGKIIVWNCAADLPGAYGSNYKVKVTADDGNGPSLDQNMVLIRGDEFEMGDNFKEGSSDELPVHTVEVDSFYMGKFEVTNQEYCDYLNSALDDSLYISGGVVYGHGNHEPYCDTSTADSDSQIAYSGGVFGVRTKNGRDMSKDPMVEVSWYGAAAYCNWRSEQEGKEQCYDLSTWDCDFSQHGYRLPTEAEWEYAARGGLKDKRFPWGNTISHNEANYYSNAGYSYDVSATPGYHPDWNDGIYPYTSPVGSFAANNYYLCDMAGNVWEWCNDWYDRDYYDYDTSPMNNPTGPTGTRTYRVLRGGGWNYFAYGCRVAYRGYDWPYGRYDGIGFRLVLDFQ